MTSVDKAEAGSRSESHPPEGAGSLDAPRPRPDNGASGIIVHEWIEQTGGAENVLAAFADIYPEAALLCLWDDSDDRFDRSRLRETWLARTPLRRSKALALPVMSATWRHLRDRGHEWALISSHAFAHHARFRGAGEGPRKFVYVHTPARYLWSPDLDPRGQRWGARLLGPSLRRLDRLHVDPEADLAANSEFVRERVRHAWGRDARVIYPPVDVDVITQVDSWAGELTGADADLLAELPEGFVLGASRFTPYKRLDRAIEVGEAMGRPVVLAGGGPDRPALAHRAARASVPVRIVDAPSSPLLYALYQRASMFVFAAIEDFGIMPVEAMAAGTPVLTARVGGAAETVVDGVTGAHIDFDSVAEIRDGFARAESTTLAARRDRAAAFDRSRFTREITAWVGRG